MAHYIQQPPQPNIEILYNANTDETNTERFLQDAKAFNETSAQFLQDLQKRIELHEKNNHTFHANTEKKHVELEQLLQGVIKNHAELLQSLEHYKQAKRDDLEKHKNLELSFFDIKKSLKDHENATLKNITAMLGHTENIKNLLDELTERVDLLKNTEIPRLTTVVKDEQTRNSELIQNGKNLTEKFNNFLKNSAASETKLNKLEQDQQTLDTKFGLDKEAKDAALKNYRQQLEDARTTIKQQGLSIQDQDAALNGLWRKVQLYMTANAAILCTAIWIWLHAHKA